jgi:hypothetical protein
MCEGGNMGYPGWFQTPDGEPRSTQENDLVKTSANHQFVLGWTDPNAGVDRAVRLGEPDIQRAAGLPDAPESTFLEVTGSGAYRISAHRGHANENEYPELLVISGSDEYKHWFVSFEEGDGYNPTLHDYFTIAQKMEKLTVRYQFIYPDRVEDSFRMGFLGVGECVVIDNGVEVCSESLYGSEEADVSVKFPGWRVRRPSGRRSLPDP